jgi:hypothetical protein
MMASAQSSGHSMRRAASEGGAISMGAVTIKELLEIRNAFWRQPVRCW